MNVHYPIVVRLVYHLRRVNDNKVNADVFGRFPTLSDIEV